MTCFLYQLLTYFYLKHIFSWPLIVTYLSEKYISYITVFSKFLHVGYYLVILPNAILNIALKKTGFSDICKISSGLFLFYLPEPRVQGSFFLNTFCLTPVLLFVCPSSNVFLSDFLSRTISNFNQIWQSIVEEL